MPCRVVRLSTRGEVPFGIYAAKFRTSIDVSVGPVLDLLLAQSSLTT